MNPLKISFTNRRYLDAVEDHVVLYDGATGTELAKYDLQATDFGGVRTEGLMEMLLLHRPEVVAAAHAAYLAAGAEVIETNSFRANRITLVEFGLAARTVELNRRAAELARRVADRYAAEMGAPRFVAGSMGPTGKLPSLDDPELSGVTFDELAAVYAEQARGLLQGGVDVLLLETQQDLLEIKAAIHGIWRTFEALEVRVPIQAQMTLDASGHLLTGPDVEAVVVTLAALPVDIIGMNCSTGPEEMRESVRRLLEVTNRPVSVLPNAGMPENVDGRAVYRLQPEPFAATMTEFAEWGVRIIGGCCGTGPEHIRTLAHSLSRSPAFSLSRSFAFSPLPLVASNMQAVALHQEPRPLIVGERINTQGSRRARRLVLNREYDALLALAEHQVGYGAHVLDVCLALTERDDEAESMEQLVKLLALHTPAPLMIDTTEIEVLRVALEHYPGRVIINSVNLEQGEEHARAVLILARDFGAALIALTIDEQGLAQTTERKLSIAKRLYRLAVEEIGLPPHALIFDLLTLTLATGDQESAGAAVATLDALRRTKAELPGTLTNLGVSNVSYGLKPPARRVLNSVFLYRAVEAGLDLAIVNPAQITPYADISPVERKLAGDLIFNRDAEALTRYITHFAEVETAPEVPEETSLPPEQALYQAVLHRRREGLETLLESCLQQMPPLAVLNAVLLPAMQEVGARFGRGELILPFVLGSARTMKLAVSYLEPRFAHTDATSKGVVVLATVFGDVHDIGKNLVKTILANNGYTVHDLGKQVPVETIVERAVEVGADAIGLSALLVATSKQMERVVESLRRRGLRIPVLIGGAATNQAFALRIAVDKAGAPYQGGVHYCRDAFEAMQVLENVILRQPQPPAEEQQHSAVEPQSEDEPLTCATCAASCPLSTAAANPPATLSAVPPLATQPAPPFWGAQVIREIPHEEIYPYLDRRALFRVGWGAKGATGARWEQLQAQFTARLEELWAAAGYLRPQAAYGYFPAQAEGNTLVIYAPDDPAARREIARFHFPRQSKGAQLCLADYFQVAEEGELAVVPLQIVTVGHDATERLARLEGLDKMDEAYYVHGLAAQAAEATAAWLHARIRRELGLAPEQGKRYSWGYPACPELSGHRTLFALLPAEKLGLALTGAYQFVPEYSTAALVVPHPAARYFAVR
ncbi:MAG: methionine synthase [Chloroflexota bacterium]|nr:methionine synthase [Chloroflexota bacterium]